MPETNYQEMYLSEALEHIEIMNQALLKLEENPKSKEYIDLIFRSAHTIKGMATTMGYVQTKELCKNIENIFDKIRKKQKEMTPQLATAIFKCIDSLYQMITDTNKKIDLDSLISILENPEESKDINNFDTISSVQLPTISVKMSELDSLVNLVGELIISKMKLKNSVTHQIQKNLSQMLLYCQMEKWH